MLAKYVEKQGNGVNVMYSVSGVDKKSGIVKIAVTSHRQLAGSFLPFQVLTPRLEMEKKLDSCHTSVFSIGPFENITPEALYLADVDVTSSLITSDEPHKHSMVRNPDIHRVKRVKQTAQSSAPAPLKKPVNSFAKDQSKEQSKDQPKEQSKDQPKEQSKEQSKDQPKEQPKEQKDKAINSFFKNASTNPKAAAEKSKPAAKPAANKKNIDKLAERIIDPDEDIIRKPTKTNARVILDSSDDEPQMIATSVKDKAVSPKRVQEIIGVSPVKPQSKPEEPSKPQPKPKAKAEPKAEPKKVSPQKLNGLEGMFDNDEDMPDVPVAQEMPIEQPEQALPLPANGEKRRKRKRIVRTRTTQDEKGYLGTFVIYSKG
jgi:hypothetical protein